MASDPYYPPRANWTRHLRMFVWKMRAYTQSQEIQNRTRISVGTFELSLANLISLLRTLVPGLSLRDAGYYRAGKLVARMWISLALIAFFWIGTSVSNAAYVLMISLHASSLIYLLSSQSPQQRLLRRIVQPLLIVLLFGQIIYPLAALPIRHHLLLPLSVNGKHILINRLNSTAPLKPGDYVAYKVNAINRGGIRGLEGYAFEKILAGPKDRIVFEGETFSINGKSFPSISGMPERGSRVVPEGNWFIWPTDSIHITRQGHAPDTVAEKASLALAIVPNTNIIGKPINNWLWHPQTP